MLLRENKTLLILTVAIVPLLLAGCGTMRYAPSTPEGGGRPSGRPRVIVYSMVNTYRLVIINFDSLTAEVYVNGRPECILPPRAICTPEVKASRFSYRSSRAEFVVTAFAVGPDGEDLQFSAKRSFYSGSQPKLEADEVRIKFPGSRRRR